MNPHADAAVGAQQAPALAVGCDAQDEAWLRRAIALGEAAVARGSRPFGAVVARGGLLVAEASAVATTDTRDWTAHSEMLALRAASAALSWDELAGCTLYASGEPCPMCAAALYWCNLSRLVYGLSEPQMRALRSRHVRAMGIEIGAREILGRAPRAIEVIGPCLEDAARQAHERFWPTAAPHA
jgi:tRNA(Arg) A34 adenosine deaminase TadA